MFSNSFRFAVFLTISVLTPISTFDQSLDVGQPLYERPGEDAESMLRGAGIHDYGVVFWRNASPEIQSCLHFPDVKARLLQVCTMQDRGTKCDYNRTTGESNTLFEDCSRDACYARIDSEGVYCRIASGRPGTLIGPQAPGLECGLPENLASTLDQWDEPPWMRTIGGQSNFHCMTAFPDGTALHYRLLCVKGHPEIEIRIQFPPSFLAEYTQPRCLVRDRCGGPLIYTSEALCFEAGNNEVHAESPSPDYELETLNDLENLDFSRAVVPRPFDILVFIGILYMLMM